MQVIDAEQRHGSTGSTSAVDVASGAVAAALLVAALAVVQLAPVVRQRRRPGRAFGSTAARRHALWQESMTDTSVSRWCARGGRPAGRRLQER
jgi:hypothetical protein